MSNLTFYTRCGILITALLMYCQTLSAQVNSLPGSGTTTDPYRISTVAELKFMRDKVNSDNVNYGNKVYKLMADLDFSGESSWVPIGTFKGTFDGRGKVIRNITCGTQSSPSAYSMTGLFGYLDGASVLKLGIEWKEIYISFSTSTAGGIAGFIMAGNITDCYSTGPITSVAVGVAGSTSQSFIGGIVGQNSGQIINCYSMGTITSSSSSSSNSMAGGIAGINISLITNCYSGCNVSVASSGTANAGGIAGQNVMGQGVSGQISNSYASGNVTASSVTKNAISGGIVGLNAGSILNCLALNDSITSIAGSTSNAMTARIGTSGTLTNNFASTTMVVKRGISASELTTVTNFSGQNQGANLTGIPVDLLNAWVSSNPVISGITIKTWKVMTGINNNLPYFEPTIINPPVMPTGSGTQSDPYCISSISNLKWVRDKINSDNPTYGNKVYKLLADLDFDEEVDWVPIGNYSQFNSNSFSGFFDGNGKVIRYIHIGTPETPSKVENAGFFGNVKNGTVVNLGVEWSGIYTSSTSVGGIVGLNNGVLNNCYATGLISDNSTTYSYTGGIAGQNNSPIVNCHFDGTIYARSDHAAYVGGITGLSYQGNITNCYTSGTISGASISSESFTGGIAGNYNVIISNCYSRAAIVASSNSKSYASGIACNDPNANYQIDGSISNCIALNSSITAIASSSIFAFAYRIGNLQTTQGTINFISNSIIIKIGTSEYNLSTLSNFDDLAKYTDQPLNTLNDWVNKTKLAFSGQELYTWKVGSEINDGYPIFDSVIMPLYDLKGSGSERDPFLINNVSDLWIFTVKVKNENASYGNKFYKLMSDLDFAGQGDWIPIGSGDSIPNIGINSFSGTFDGNGKVIRNIKIGTQIKNSNIDCAGLFGYIKGGKVINLAVIWNGIHINSKSFYTRTYGGITGGFVGGIAGVNNGIISNCRTMGTLVSYATKSYIGGIAGFSLGTIINCNTSVIASSNGYTNTHNMSNIRFDSHIGGISGRNAGTISNCYTTGHVAGIFAGGIAGDNSGSYTKRASIINCYSSGFIVALSDYDLDRSEYSSEVVYAGGICGTNEYGKIKNCIALNTSITSISKYAYQTNTYRIAYGTDTTGISNNYALASMSVKTGKSADELSAITSFNSPKQGADFNGKPLIILNDWLNFNPAANGIPNKKWKIIDDVNKGLPIFEDQTSEIVRSINLSGSGTNTDPYTINTIEDLQLMRDLVNFNNIDYGNKFYRLMNDLDLVGQDDWGPIGASEVNSFKGTFDGNRKVIKNIKIGSSLLAVNIEYAGLFGYIKEGIIMNLGVEWEGIFTFSKNVGGVTGLNYSGIVKNCYTIGQINQYSNSVNVGGIVGYNTGYFNNSNKYGEITNCFSRVDVMGTSVESSNAKLSAGGIAGTCEDGRITNCYATGSIKVKSSSNEDQSTRAGGISGWTFGQANYCIALNNSIVAIAGSNAAAWSYRIGWLGGDMNNFASPTIDIRNGVSESDLTAITDFSQGFNNSHGNTLTEAPVLLLNNWVKSNPVTNNIPNKLWKVSPNVNDGYPIFEDQIVDGIKPVDANYANAFHIYGGKGIIVVEGESAENIKVFDINGRLILQQSATENHTLLNVDKIGVYVVAVYDSKSMKQKESQKVIVFK